MLTNFGVPYFVKLFLFVKVLIFFLLINADAQYEDKIAITPPSPNNIFAASYLNSSVNLYSGIPSIGLPIYELKAKELSVPISCIYKGGGIRLQDVASSVGLGWSMKAGGMITRLVRGLPDESEKGYIGKNKTGEQVNNGGETNQGRADKIASGEWDGEPDLFFISTPGGDLSFVFDEKGVPVFNQPTRCKISFERTNGPDDNSSITWHFIDANGVHYLYGVDDSARENVNETTEFTSTWYLSRMYSFNKTDEITFDYIEGNDVTTTTYNRLKVNFSNSGGCNSPSNFETTNNTTRTYKKVKYLSGINSSAGKLKFNYMTQREDVQGAYSLYQIELYNLSDVSPVKTFLFGYDYYSTVDPDKGRNRLCLRSISTSAGKDMFLKLYDLKYYYDPLLKFPARNSAAFDHWGFYNNNSEATPFAPQADKQPVLDKTLQYTLQSIEHAQSGKTEFLYELNSYLDPVTNADKPTGGLRIRAIKEYDNTGKVYTRSYEYKLDNGKSSGQVALKNIQYVKYSGLIVLTSPTTGCAINVESWNAGLVFNINDINGVYTGYSKVKVIDPDGGNTTYNFTNFGDFPDNFSIFNSQTGSSVDISNIRQFGYSTSNAHKRGLLQSKISKTVENKPVSEYIYEYGQLQPLQKKSRGVALSLSVNALAVNNYFENVYYQIRDNYQLIKETEKTYDMKNVTLFASKTKSYTYNPAGTLIRTTNYNSSEGQSYYDKVYYPENRAEIAGLSNEDNQAYVLMNELTVPVREEHFTTDNNKVVKHSSYVVQNDGNSAHTKVFLKKILSARNSNVFQEDVDLTYDFITGNLKTEAKRNGQRNSFLWSKDNAIVAKVEYADNNEIYYQSFEELPNAIIGKAYAGKKYFSGSFTIPFVRPNSKSYLLTYRKLVSDKWESVTTTYTMDNMVLNIAVPIDDIRIYPEGAQMTTYTHLPLIGITSAADYNDNIQYFEYDDMLRLKVIRDMNGSIIKQLSYQYACNCFYSLPRASIVIRNTVTDDDGTYALTTGDVYVVMTDDNGNPSANNTGAIFNYKETTTTKNGTTSEDMKAIFSGPEKLIYSGIISEYFFDSKGKPVRYTILNFSKLPGAGYK